MVGGVVLECRGAGEWEETADLVHSADPEAEEAVEGAGAGEGG